jgi:hypothetical protein
VVSTLSALRQHGIELDAVEEAGPTWVRTVRTTDDGRFVVAVTFGDDGTDHARHGVGTGANPLEAAARATLDAVDDRSPP